MITGIEEELRTQTLLRRIEAWAQQELGAKQRLVELLEGQERALATRQPDELEAVSARLLDHLRGEPNRASALAELLDRLAEIWEVEPLSLTLSSIAARVGDGATRLNAIRVELRRVCEHSLRLGRRIALVAQAQRSVLSEALQLLIGPRATETNSCGGLVDAEA